MPRKTLQVGEADLADAFYRGRHPRTMFSRTVFLRSPDTTSALIAERPVRLCELHPGSVRGAAKRMEIAAPQAPSPRRDLNWGGKDPGYVRCWTQLFYAAVDGLMGRGDV